MKNVIAQAWQNSNAPAEEASPADIESGKIISLVGYIICLVAIIPFVQRNNRFSLFHAKQALSLLVVSLGLSVVAFVLGFVFGMIGLGIVATIISLAMSIGLLGLVVLGATNAWNGRMAPLPLIGGLAAKLFGNVAVKQ